MTLSLQQVDIGVIAVQSLSTIGTLTFSVKQATERFLGATDVARKFDAASGVATRGVPTSSRCKRAPRHVFDVKVMFFLL